MLLLLVGCLFDRATYEARLEELTDHDGDGIAQLDDCDDAEPAVFPGAEERCNGIDDDCDGTVDASAVDVFTWYNDADADGFGLASAVERACAAPEGYVADGTDCDDANADRRPGNPEVPYDGVDQDCDGADADDLDADGYAALEAGGTDCDDTDPAVHPGATEAWADGFTDNDCVAGNEGGREEFGTDAFVGRIAGGQAGGNLAALGDISDDGGADFAVAAFYDGTRAPNAGTVFIVDSATPQPLGGFTSISYSGENGYLGSALDAADIDGDGTPELLVSSTGDDGGTGTLYVVPPAQLVSGADNDVAEVAGATVRGPHAGSYFGAQARFVPDVDGDGLLDIVASAPLADAAELEAAGVVWVFSGGSVPLDGPVLTTAAAEFEYSGDVAWDIIGNGVTPLGDQDGDGVDDLLICDGVDEAWVVAGGTASASIDAAAVTRIAEAIADTRRLDDVDDDGRPDALVLGTQPYIFADLKAHAVWTSAEAYARIDTHGDVLTDAINLGDRDGDGSSESVLFVTQAAELGTGWAGIVAGSEWGFAKNVDAYDADLFAVATRPGAGFGYRAAAVGAVGGGDESFFAVGGWLDDEGGVDAGAVVLLRVPE